MAPHRASRREVLKAGGAALATVAAPGVIRAQEQFFNILFVFSDQERYFHDWPADLELPGHERLQRRGVTFHNHYTAATMCTPSRSVLMTGLQTADTGMFDNTNAPFQPALSTRTPTYGHMLRTAGIYPAYNGKWHLNADFDTGEPYQLFVNEMEAYGFHDYTSIGDVIGHERGGFRFDHMVAGNAVTWLRDRGKALNVAGTPWALTVSLVNPHDVMFFNTDEPWETVQDPGNLLMPTTRAPDHALYRRGWAGALPKNLRQPFDEPGRPRAHGEYDAAWSVALGAIPDENPRWRRLNDYYINCIRDVDRQLVRLLDELDALGLAERTIVIYTSDHGEMAGAHGLRGKGPFAYEESTHLPFYVVHPDVNGGQDCRALTSHIDVAPTILSLMGLDADRRGEAAGRDLPGKDIGEALQNPKGADIHALREDVLFTYSALMTVDAELLRRVAAARAEGKPAKAAFADGFRPDLGKRGNLRMVCDDRYKFARYFGPAERNRPTTLDELYARNDVELFDIGADPHENVNLAARKGEHDELVLEMNAKLNARMDAEYGPDDGREMPDVEGVDWAIERPDL